MFRPRLRPLPDPIIGASVNAGSQYIRKDTRFEQSADNPKLKGFEPTEGGIGNASYTIDGQKIEITFKDNLKAGKKGIFDAFDEIASMKVNGKEVSGEIGDATRQKIINRNNYDVVADQNEIFQGKLNKLEELSKKAEQEGWGDSITVSKSANGNEIARIDSIGASCELNVDFGGQTKHITRINIGDKHYTISPPVKYSSDATIVEVVQSKLNQLMDINNKKMDELDEAYRKLDIPQ